MQEILAFKKFIQKIYFERGISKSLKKVDFMFVFLFFVFLNLVPFNGQDYEKQKGPGTCGQTLFRLQMKFRKNSFISDVLPDPVS